LAGQTSWAGFFPAVARVDEKKYHEAKSGGENKAGAARSSPSRGNVKSAAASIHAREKTAISLNG